MADENKAINWQSFFLAMGAGAVVVMQGYGQIQHSTVSSEIKSISKDTVSRELLDVTRRGFATRLDSLTTRLDLIEREILEKGISMPMKKKEQ